MKPFLACGEAFLTAERLGRNRADSPFVATTCHNELRASSAVGNILSHQRVYQSTVADAVVRYSLLDKDFPFVMS